jgi:hypothetical protein
MVKFTLALLLLSLPFVESVAWATADGPDCWAVKGVAKNDVLNVREKPNASSKIIGAIPSNTRSVQNANDTECPDAPTKNMPKECGSGWCKVKYKAVVGWVNCRFLEIPNDCGH